MVKYLKEFQFVCDDELSYFISGAEVKTHNLTLKAPSMISQVAPLISQDIMVAIKSSFEMPKIDDEAKLKQIQAQAQQQSQQNIDDDEPIKIKSKDILTLLYSTKAIDMDKFRNKFMLLLLEKNICMLDNQIPITRNHFEHISYREFNRLLGEYITNFLIP